MLWPIRATFLLAAASAAFSSTDDVCGVPHFKPDVGWSNFDEAAANIIGGQEAVAHSWPWMARIILHDIHGDMYCGGVVLNKRWVATYAGCFDGFQYLVEWKKTTVELGVHDRSQYEPMVFKVNPNGVRVPQKYLQMPGYNIALIELDDDIPFNEYIQPICLPRATFSKGTLCYTTGWGLVKRGSVDYATKLKQIGLPILSNDTDVSVIFAGYPEGGPGPCDNDEGGPLMCKGDDGAWQLVGINIVGDVCGQRAKTPGNFTGLRNSIDWIKRYTNH